MSKVNTNTFPHRQHGRTGKQGLKKKYIIKFFNIWANYFSEKTIYKRFILGLVFHGQNVLKLTSKYSVFACLDFDIVAMFVQKTNF